MLSNRAQTLHYKNLRQIFGKYVRTVGKDSHDVWLMSDDKKLIAGHQFVLAACSPYFDSVFHELNDAFETSDQKMILVMRGSTGKSLEKLVDFMYKGPDVLHDDAEDPAWKQLYTLGQELEVIGLLESITEKRKSEKPANGSSSTSLDLIVFPNEEDTFNGNFIRLDDLMTEQVEDFCKMSPMQDETTGLVAEKEGSQKSKWTEKAGKIMDQIRNGTKQKPTTAREFVNDIFSNNIKYVLTNSLIDDVCCTVVIDGETFLGVGGTNDEAREDAALSIITKYLNLVFSF